VAFLLQQLEIELDAKSKKPEKGMKK